jgi:hypothetical protein
MDTTEMDRKLRRYINANSANVRPFHRKYSDPMRRIVSNEFAATGVQSEAVSIKVMINTSTP